jgi:hypothetical protein
MQNPMKPPAPRTESGQMAAQVPTIPEALAPRVTSAEELERREAAAERKAIRSRIAEIVAFTVVIMSALAEIARGIAAMFHHN